tara:strand:+ start:101 stop:826 length:726 start_codon:yes stop_codon:yes gene_type:complete
MKYLLIILCSILLSNPIILDSSKSLDTILSSYVDDAGNVDYKGIVKNPFALNEYLNFIEQISPDSHPDYFKTEDSKKAYWINVYNALILKIMIENPGKDILDIGYIGHDVFLKRFKVGNKRISPSFIENKILRKMKDPRIHFAINCASKSCPPLGNRILLETDLDKQLDQKAFKFINNTDNVFINHEEQTIYLNKIFKWFEKDFENLKSYISIYLDDIDIDLIKNYNIKFFKYDWSKNSSK